MYPRQYSRIRLQIEEADVMPDLLLLCWLLISPLSADPTSRNSSVLSKIQSSVCDQGDWSSCEVWFGCSSFFHRLFSVPDREGELLSILLSRLIECLSNESNIGWHTYLSAYIATFIFGLGFANYKKVKKCLYCIHIQFFRKALDEYIYIIYVWTGFFV